MLRRTVAAVVFGLGAGSGCGGGPTDELRPGAVLPGLDRIEAEGAGDLRGKRVGLITNHTGRTVAGIPAARVLLDAGVEVRVLFGPEHGLSGAAAAGESVAGGVDPDTGLPVISLYGASRAPEPEQIAGLDALVFDLQDLGVRFYTYISTLRLSLAAAAAEGLEFWVLDRPNPNRGDRVEGPVLDLEFRSFVGTDRLPLLHGMTVGELARLFAARAGGAVRVVPAAGWTGGRDWEDLGLPWRAPSPNIPDLHTALVYPGFGLFEGVELSEGRGTDSPFEVIGGPGLDSGAWLAALGGASGIPGLTLAPARFTPRPLPAAPAPRFAGEVSEGLRVRIRDLDSFRPVRAALTVLAAARGLAPEVPRWRRSGERYWIDLLLGTDRIRLGLDAGVPVPDLLEQERPAIDRFLGERRPHLLYPRP